VRSSAAVIWHDIECGGYRADLPLWRELAAEARGPILDVGAGTGRVALDLAAAGHEVVALDRDADLIAELDLRRGELPVRTVVADARSFELNQRFELILVPMQTVQLLEEREDRAGFLRRAAAHLEPGGLLAAALADPFEGFDSEHTEPPAPDVDRRGGVTYASQPVAVRREAGSVVIERIRRTVDPDGRREAEPNAVRLAALSPELLEREARDAAELEPRPRLRIPETQEHVGSTVVVLRA
jgi:SAM-dependent methyltransferase